MADDDVSVKISGEASGATDSLKEVADGVKEVKEQISAVAEGTKSFKDAFLAAFTVEKVLEFVEAMTNAATQVERLTTALGASAAQIDTFDVGARAAGTSVGAISEAFTKLENTVARAASGQQRSVDALADFNLKAKDFIGLSLTQKMDLVADKLAEMRDGTAKTAAATQLLGGVATSLLPILNEGAGAFDKYAEVSQRAGSVATPLFLAEMSRLDLAMIETTKSLGGLGMEIATQFGPALAGLASTLSTVVQGMTNSAREGGTFAIALQTLVVAAQGLATAFVIAVAAIQTLWEVVKTTVFAMGEAFFTLGRLIKDVFTFNFAQAAVDFDALGAQMVGRAKITATNMESVMKSMTGSLKTIWNQAAEDQDKSDQTLDINRKRRNQDAIQAALARAEAEVTAAREVLRQKTSILDLEASLGQITQNKKFQQLEQYTEAAYQKELQALNSELAIGGLRVQQQQQILNRIRQLKAAHETEMINLDKQSIQAQFAHWKTYTDAVAGAFNSQLRGILTGQTSFSQAMKNIFLDLSIKTIELLVTKPVSEYIAGQLALLTATQSGAAAKAATEVAATEATLPLKIAAFTSDLTARAALTFAGIMANLSPVMGPLAAGPAAAGEAVVMAQMAAVPKFDVGAWSVPRTGLAVVHAGEMIAPAGAPADAARSAFTGGGGDTHIHVHAWDAGSVQSWLRNGGAAQLAKPISRYQDKNPSSRNRR